MSKLYRLLFALAALAMLVSPAAAQNRNYVARLNAADAIVSRSEGQAIFQKSRDSDTIGFRLIVANLSNTTQAHIHVASVPGADGPVAVWLHPHSPPGGLIPGRFSGVLNTGTLTEADFRGPLLGQDMQTLMVAIAEGRAYVNVRTTANPGGEIRGTIR